MLARLDAPLAPDVAARYAANVARTMAIGFGLRAQAWGGDAPVTNARWALPFAILGGGANALRIVSRVVLFGKLDLPARAATEQLLA